jgi:hypothetical protein
MIAEPALTGGFFFIAAVLAWETTGAGKPALSRERINDSIATMAASLERR